MDDPPERIGPYTVTGVLGEGATGVVYAAEQSEPLQRTVALKILRAGGRSRQVLANFEAERQALAVMDHPSIAKVFDAGIADDGSPYVVMERVGGAPLEQYCDDRRLTVRSRVALLAEVCKAVQHAHQKGVVHRDLKPAHILVSDVNGRPLPRIIDFGIAVALDPAGLPDPELGDYVQVVGTPGYMSPEQIEGSTDIDTRSDVYSLGVILYELLVGTLPYETDHYTGWAALTALVLQDPPTPTQRLSSLDDTQDTVASLRGTTLGALRMALRGDLEWIVARAMAKDRSQRYGTAQELAAELERYLAHEPVLARGPSRSYRAWKFARRHRAGVVAASIAVAALATFATTSSMQARRIARARNEAEAMRAQAEGLIDFMLSELRSRLESVGRLDILDAVGDRALEYFEALPAERYSDAELSSRSQALYQIGQVRLEQGRLPEAGRALDESLRLARALSARAPADDDRLFRLGQAEFWAGERARRQGDVGRAMAHFTAYRDISAELARRDPRNLTYQLEVGYSHTNVGAIKRAHGDLEGALAEFAASLDAKKRVAAADAGNPSRRYDVGQGHNTMAVAYHDLGRLDDAKAHYERDLAIKDSLVGEYPENATWRYRLAASHHFLSLVLHDLGDLEGASHQIQNAMELLAPLVARDPTNLRWLRSFAAAEVRAAHVLGDLGRPGAGRAPAESGHRRLAHLVKQNPEQPEWRANLATAARAHATILLSLGRSGEAESVAREALLVAGELAEGAAGERTRVAEVAQAELLLGRVLLERGERSGALELHQSALARLTTLESGPTDGELLVALALAYGGRTDDALELVARLEVMGYRMPELARIRELASEARSR